MRLPRPFRDSTNERPDGRVVGLGSSRRARTGRLAAAAVLALVAPVAVLASPASSTSAKGSLAILSVSDNGTGLAGTVAGRPFSVVVQARNTSGAPLVLTSDTKVRLSLASGPGQLSGVLDAVISKKTSQTTLSGAVYSAVANGVAFKVSQVSGTALSPATVTGVGSARSAVRTPVTAGQGQNVTDPGCAAPTPTSPVCGFLRLPRGATGSVLMSVGSCDTILSCRKAGATSAELVTATANLKDAAGNPLYTRSNPATLVLACDKSLCGNGGVGKFPVTIDLTDTGAFTTIPACPAKGVLGANQDACADQVQSSRDNAGDLYTYVLFVHDIRGSYP